MLLDKLWVRIRGSLLVLKDDLSLGEDIRRKAEGLLEKLDLREETDELESRSDAKSEVQQLGQAQGSRKQTLEEIRQEWEGLLRRKEQDEGQSSEELQPPPNPRKLG